MVKNITVKDLALIELARGSTNAPASVMQAHEGRGYVKLKGGKWALTEKGRKRAEALQGSEATLRTMAVNSESGCAIRAVAGCSITGAPHARRK